MSKSNPPEKGQRYGICGIETCNAGGANSPSLSGQSFYVCSDCAFKGNMRAVNEGGSPVFKLQANSFGRR